MTREEAIEFIAQSVKSDVDMALVADAIKALNQEPTTKNDLGVDCIDKAELLKAMDTWDKFGNDPNNGLIPLRTPALQDRYVPYVKYDDMVNCVKTMPSVTPQEPFINKSCVSSEVCEHDKNKVLDKIRTEIEELDVRYEVEDYATYGKNCPKYVRLLEVVKIIDKYKAESEDKE